MKQLFKTSIFLLLALLQPAITSAYEFEVDGIYYTRLFGEIISDSEVAVTYDKSSYGPSYSGDITIPASVTYEGNTYSVTAIGEGAFSSCMGLTSIVIPNSVRYIGDYAFFGCQALASIDIPNSVNYIGQGAFEYTKWYNDQPDGLVYAGLIAYQYKGNMPAGTNLALADGTVGIAEWAFLGCEGLVSIDIPNSVQYIDNYAFNECYNLTSIDLPNSVTNIGDAAFQYCIGLTSLSIGKSVNTIGSDAFFGCRNLSSITVASGNRNYDSRDNCNAIIRTSSNKLMTGCKSTIIPNSVTSIDMGAYVSGSGMTMLVIPSSVTTIGYNAFVECSDLDTVKCLSTVPPEDGYCFSEDTYTNATLVVPHGSEEAYALSSGWCLFNIEGWNSAGPGDVNADGQLNITDVTVLIDYLLSGNSFGVSMLGADVNLDGQVNIADVAALIDKLLNSDNR